MSLADWIAERPEPEAPDADPDPFPHTCWRNERGDCRACAAEEREAEEAAS